MSRTLKDRPSNLRFPSDDNWVYTEGYGKRDLPNIEPTKTKKRRTLDIDNHWMSTPGYWVRMKMNIPQRRAVHLWEHKLSNIDTSPYNDNLDSYPYEDLDMFDRPSK